MRDGEITRKDTIENLKYLKDKGFEKKYLSQIHHNSNETYEKSFDYWGNEIKKIISDKNFKYADRIKFIVEEHKKTGETFFRLVQKALMEYPKN